MSSTRPAPASGAKRRRLLGVQAVQTALADNLPLRVLMVPRGPLDDALEPLVAAAEVRGAHIWRASAGDLRRMSPDSRTPHRVIGMVGPDPRAPLADALAGGGLTWLLHGAAYPSNVGFAIRTGEVSGADAVVVDAPGFNHADRSRASHVSMGADRLLPVLFETADRTLCAARARGHRVLALEDSGDRAPWDEDLTGPVVVVVGNERHGLPEALLERCDAVMRIPMPGFVPSYNVQATIAAVAHEHLRQLHASALAASQLRRRLT